LTPDTAIMAVVKADAYGHGAAAVARSIRDRVEGFAVAGIDEAEELVSAGVNDTVFLLSGFHESTELEQVSERGFIPVIHASEQLEQLERAKLPRPLKLWLKFDSGMHRIGFAPAQVAAALERLRNINGVSCTGLMSHLACADDRGSTYSAFQMEVFEKTTSHHRQTRSLANSAGICGWPRSLHDWARPGIMMYGCTPMLDANETELGLKPVMSLSARIIATLRLERGDLIGYGGDWRCPENMRVGVVACGYGDGYPRHAPSGTPVWVGGKRAAVVGRVSMDMMSIDLRDHDHVGVGDQVELWGNHVTATEVAASAGTISYELLAGVTRRVPRRVVEVG
jgi:alanine racemase